MMSRVGALREKELPMRTAILWSVFLIASLSSIAAFYLGSKPLKIEQPKLPEAQSPLKLEQPTVPEAQTLPAGMARATFGGGCFWCTEAVFQNLKAVQSVVSGYTGGSVKNPTYHQVCSGTTGHAEAIQITYDPRAISYEELLEVFWKTHDPTTLNQQGNDYGTQYRSAIFYHDDEQKVLAVHYKQKLDASGLFPAPIVTEIVPFTEFYRAESYHQNYYNQNAGQPYCRAVISPKLDKLKELFSDKLTNTPAN
jgi:peptide-methionine (S)-S-oxide reductase